MKIPLNSLICAAVLAAVPLSSVGGIVTFAEYDGIYGDDDPIPPDLLPAGVPDGIDATWTGFALHTIAGDTPMSIFPVDELPGADDATIRFSAAVMIQSINVYDTDWGGPTNGSPVTLIGRRWGKEVWRYTSPGDHLFQKVTVGAGKEIDTLAFEGRWNHYDDIEIEAAPDTDGDTYTDGDEIATGHDPNDPANNPTAQAIADSIVEFTTTGIQGENDWYYGYRNTTIDGGAQDYDPGTQFLEFPPDSWRGAAWDLNTAASAPWTELGQRTLHPNAGTGDKHWPIRRWVANEVTNVTPLAIRWHVHHVNVTCGGNGVTGLLYVNGKLVDKAVIAAPDNIGETHTYYINATPGDRIDLALNAKGPNGIENDGCDGSEDWFLVDPTMPANPLQPDGSIFVPAGSGDTDADGLPDVWEKSYFPNDLTKLSRTGDFENDGVADLIEYQRGSNPTVADSDGDGLGDVVETATGKYVSKTDTGSSPVKSDTDADTISDFNEVNRSPPTDPNKADTDGDLVSDAAEIAWGTNPLDPKDYPLAYVIANSEAEFSGVQGSNSWYYGYRLFDITGAVDYNPGQDFIPFVGGEGQGVWDGITQTWNDGQWDLNTASAGPWTEMGPLNVHPNGTNSPVSIDGTFDDFKEHWPIRRWIASKLTTNTPATIIWQIKKTNLAGTGVTGLLFINGKLVDSKAIVGTDGTGEIRRYATVLKPADIVDLAQSPTGPEGDHQDGSDGSQDWFWVDARPTPVEITISNPAIDIAQSKFSLKWNSQAGVNYTVWGSPDMKTWTQLQTVVGTAPESSYTETLPSPTPAARFYRVTR